MQANVRRVACFVGALTCLAYGPLTAAPVFAQESAKQSGLPPGAESDAPEDQEAGAATPAVTTPEKPAADAPAAAATQPAAVPPAAPPPADAAAAPADTTAPPADAAAALPAAVPADPIVTAVRAKLGEAGFATKSFKDDTAAAVAFYDAHGAPLWVDTNGFTAKGKAAIDEVKKADDWGLQASQFDLPALSDSQRTPEVLAEAEARLTLELLKYARYAKGGRVNPSSLSRILDVVPPIKDPKVVMAELSTAEAPDAYLRGLHPKHVQFQRLREALLKARGPTVTEEAPVDEALKIKLPKGKTVKSGTEHADIALLRQRLKVPAEEGGKDTLLDDKLSQALKSYQAKNGLKATGSLTPATRTALNREGEPKRAADPGTNITRLIINMERWRWLPDDMGSMYVWNNIPEYYTRVIKNGEEIFKEKIIVGQPAWATPVFSAKMQYIIFNPSWGVPDGIKTRELAPRLRAAGGGFFLFNFGGGGGSIIRAYGFNVYRGGRQIDPDSVDWSNADLRAYSFVQPPGGKNPLGIVKFRFPNKHDVYMHDTVERELFAQSSRALSHGCIRVQNPRRFAEILLGEGNDYSDEKVADEIAGGGQITMHHHVPVHMTYFTAMVDDTGRISTFSDIYGHDSRLASALMGRTLKYESAIETSSADLYGDDYSTASSAPPQRKVKRATKQSYSGPESIADAISDFLGN